MGSALIDTDFPPRWEWPPWVEALVRVAWGAGYLDGEGYFQTRSRVECEINVDSVHPQAIYELARIFGGNPRGAYSSKYRNRFRWRIGGDPARSVARRLVDLDLLWNKRVEAEAVALSKRFPANTAQGQLLRKRAHENRWTEYPLERHEDDPTD